MTCDTSAGGDTTEISNVSHVRLIVFSQCTKKVVVILVIFSVKVNVKTHHNGRSLNEVTLDFIAADHPHLPF